jgi:hypothetical protein
LNQRRVRGNTGHTLRSVGSAPGRILPRAPLILGRGDLGSDVYVQRAGSPVRGVAPAGYAIRDAGKDRRVFAGAAGLLVKLTLGGRNFLLELDLFWGFTLGFF